MELSRPNFKDVEKSAIFKNVDLHSAQIKDADLIVPMCFSQGMEKARMKSQASHFLHPS